MKTKHPLFATLEDKLSKNPFKNHKESQKFLWKREFKEKRRDLKKERKEENFKP